MLGLVLEILKVDRFILNTNIFNLPYTIRTQYHGSIILITQY